MRYTVLHRDPRILVADKAPGLLSVPPPKGPRGASLIELLRRAGEEVHAVHRLDRESSGLVLLARDLPAREILMGMFKRREVRKTYLAVVQGHPRPGEGVLRFPIRDLGARAAIDPRGSAAETAYRVIEQLGSCALVEVEPHTGRHNQIRLHFAHIGMPLAGERKYARGRDALVRHRRAALHALRLAFHPPWAKHPLVFEAPPPDDFQELLRRLRK
jgi:RluA family pseudouridine synthase